MSRFGPVPAHSHGVPGPSPGRAPRRACARRRGRPPHVRTACRAVRAARRRAGSDGCRGRATGCRCSRPTPAGARGALRRALAGRGARRAQHAAERRRAGVHRRARRLARAARRHRPRRARPAPWPSWPTRRRSWSAAVPTGRARRARGRRPPLHAAVADERSLLSHQLHQRHHRAPEGRDVPPPRRLPAGARDGGAHRAGPAIALPVDAADVPLQRLVLPLGGHRGRRHARLRCARSSRRGSGGDPRRGRHALLRAPRPCWPMLANRPAADDGRPSARSGWRPAARRPRRRCSRGWPSSASRHAPLRADRDVRPAPRSASGSRSGTTCARDEQAAAQGRGRASPTRRRARAGRRPGRHRRARPTARRSARSCCAATTSCSATTGTSEATAAAVAGRLVPHRRPRRHAPRRLHRAARPREGRHHLRRREHRLGRGRAGARRAPRGARGAPSSPRPTRSGARSGGLRHAARRAPRRPSRS